MKRLMIATAVTAIAAGTAMAATDIDTVDLDNDGFAGVEELKTVFPDMEISFFDDIDTNDDNTVERYVDSDAAIITPGAAGFDPDAEILSVRLWMLVRAEQRENAHTDTGPYTPPDGDLANITPNDPFRRLPVP